MTLPSVVERPNRKQLEQSESWIFFLVFLCGGVFLLLSFGAAQRHLQQAASFREFLLRPFDRSRVQPAPPCREFGPCSKTGCVCSRKSRTEQKHTRPRKEKSRAEETGDGRGLSCPGCAIRSSPVQLPRILQGKERPPTLVYVYAKWKLQKVSRMALSVSNLVEGGAEKEMEIKNGTASQTPRPP